MNRAKTRKIIRQKTKNSFVVHGQKEVIDEGRLYIPT